MSKKEDRIENIKDAISFVEPKKIPVGIQMLSWPFAIKDLSFNSLKGNELNAVNEYMSVVDDLQLDYTVCTYFSYDPVSSFRKLGNNSFDYDYSGIGVMHNQSGAFTMSDEDYPLLLKDISNFNSEVFLHYNFPSLRKSKEEAYSDLKQAAIEYRTFYKVNNMVADAYEKREIPTLTGAPLFYQSPLTVVFDLYRGLKNGFMDLRRHPETIREFCSKYIENFKSMYDGLDPNDVKYSYPMGIMAYTFEPMLSRKQFQEFFIDPFKDIFMRYLENGSKIFLRGEGAFINTIDLYRDLPRASVVVMVDSDDPFEMNKVIGDWCPLACGTKVNLMKSGSKEDCLYYTSKLFNEIAPGGGFLFIPDKTLMYASDVNYENIIAVYNRANELSKG